MITLDLNARLQPMHRHDIEDFLDRILHKESLGDVDGGGTLMANNGEVSRCDIAINCKNQNIDRIIEIIKAMPIPKGSIVHLENEKIEVGNMEGLAFYFSNDLEEEIYQNCDINVAIQNFDELIGNMAVTFSYAETSEFTAVYYYGSSFEKMKESILDFVNTYPLCQNSKIVQIA